MLTAVCYWSSSNCNPDKTFCPRQQCFVITVHPRTALYNLWAASGLVKGFMQPSYVFPIVKVAYILTTCPYFNNLEFDIFGEGGLQCHFITSVTSATLSHLAVRIRTISVD